MLLTTNQYVIVTDTPFQTAKMNSANTTGVSSNNSSSKAAFLGSDMWNLTLGANTSTGNAVTTTGINNTLYSIFGSSLIKYMDLSTNAVDTSVPPSGNPICNTAAKGMGCSSDWGFYECYATLLNECELYGGPIFSSSGYDIGLKKAQLPLFSLNPKLIILKNDQDTEDSRQWYWLKNVASGTRFCVCGYFGGASVADATSSYNIRLEFLLSA